MSTARRLVATFQGRKNSSPNRDTIECNSSSPRVFGSSPRCLIFNNNNTNINNYNSSGSNNELEEIAIVSSADPCQVKYGSGTLHTSVNGPRLVPGIITNQGRTIGERLSESGTYLNAGSPVRHIDSERRSSKNVSKPSFFELVSSKLGRSKQRQGCFSSSRDSLTPAYKATTVSSTASDLEISRKVRKRDLCGKLKLPSSVPLPPTCGSESLLKRRRRWRERGGSAGEISGLSKEDDDFNESDTERFIRSQMRLHVAAPNWSFVFDPAGRLCYYWSIIVSLAFLYNFWVIIYRFAFQEINGETLVVWFCLDYMADLLYLMDIVFHFRTGYLEDGVLQTDATKLRQHYMNSTTFYIDCLCLLPLDFLYLSIGFNSILRLFRLVKIYRFWAFMDRTERHTNYPNLFRSISLIHYLLVIFHWNGCLHHLIYKNNGFGSKNWVYSDNDNNDVVKEYLQSYYWCTLALTTIGDLPRPRSKSEYFYVIVQLLFGLMLFATVLGHVANIVTSVSAARKEFQAKLDGVKTYMRMRRVPSHLQVKVIKWFDYLWLTQKCSDEEKAVSCLPDKLKAEMAINVHLDTLKRVEIFQNTEAGFLCELVLRLRPVLFSPGDYICRKGEVGKEMYIVNRGRLQVVADNGKTVLATLKAGSYFGEISILNMGTAGNRRTASVRSVGYSDLFVLSKKDMWDVLKEYPAARVRLEAIAVKRLEKYKRTPLEKAAMGRSQSTPGLVESKGRIALEEMWISPVDLPGISYGRSSPVLTSRSVPNVPQHLRRSDSPLSASSSIHSSEGHPQLHTQSRYTSHRPSAGEMAASFNSMTHLMDNDTTSLVCQDTLLAEIKRLRERLITLESENAAMSMKLNQQQWEKSRCKFAEEAVPGQALKITKETRNQLFKKIEYQPRGMKLAGSQTSKNMSSSNPVSSTIWGDGYLKSSLLLVLIISVISSDWSL